MAMDIQMVRLRQLLKEAGDNIEFATRQAIALQKSIDDREKLCSHEWEGGLSHGSTCLKCGKWVEFA